MSGYWNPTKECVFYGGPMHMKELVVYSLDPFWQCYIAPEFRFQACSDDRISESVKIKRAIYRRIEDGFIVCPAGYFLKFAYVFDRIVD